MSHRIIYYRRLEWFVKIIRNFNMRILSRNYPSSLRALLLCGACIFSSQAAYSSDGRLSCLPKSSITVGCNGEACEIEGLYGILMYSVKDDISAMMRKCGVEDLKPNKDLSHNHPGVTVDILPKAVGSEVSHNEMAWEDFTCDGKVDAVFFEQLPPIYYDGKPNSPIKPRFMPESIAKAHRLLRNGGRLVIQLALDVRINSDYSKDELAKLREENPFMGYFNHSVIKGFGYEIKNPGNGPKLVQETLKFYNETLEKRLMQLDSPLLDPSFIREIREMYRKRYNPIAIVDKEYARINNADVKDILSTLIRHCVVFSQGEMMMKYLGESGFDKNVLLVWLERHQNPFNDSAGWFMIATNEGLPE